MSQILMREKLLSGGNTGINQTNSSEMEIGIAAMKSVDLLISRIIQTAKNAERESQKLLCSGTGKWSGFFQRKERGEKEADLQRRKEEKRREITTRKKAHNQKNTLKTTEKIPVKNQQKSLKTLLLKISSEFWNVICQEETRTTKREILCPMRLHCPKQMLPWNPSMLRPISRLTLPLLPGNL